MAQNVVIRIDCGNAAFDDELGPAEVARILRALAERIEDSGSLARAAGAYLRDVNGNKVGSMVVFGKP